MVLNQNAYSIKFEWGLEGAKVLAPISDICVVVDVLSFSTCVDVAVGNGAIVLPYIYKDEMAVHYARENGAILASPKRSKVEPCLSPNSLRKLEDGQRIVLPSPNGSTISFSLAESTVLCGSLRNAKSIAELAMSLGQRVSVIAAGERWDNGELRPAIEDLLGAGAILSCLEGSFSPEATLAKQAFELNQSNLSHLIFESSSGRELVERGYPEDVEAAVMLNESRSLPILKGHCFVHHSS
jgi:2-phosphosulfolactate phosphatase